MGSALLSFLLVALAPARVIAADLVLTHARVYPSPATPALLDTTLILDSSTGRIVSLSPSASSPIPAGATVLDCTGLTITAGLWNSHVHILPVDLLHADQKSGPRLASALEQMLTRWGFTSVFDVTSILANTENIRSRIASGEIAGPRILTVGEPFFPAHGIPVYVSGYLAQNHITLPDDPTTTTAVARVGRQIAAGADGVKIFAGSIEADTVLIFPIDRAKAIVAEAHRLHRPVFAHPTNLAGLDVALTSGVDVLAHVTTEKDETWSPSLIQRMIAAHMAVIPTLTLFDYEMKEAKAPDGLRRSLIAAGVARLHAFNAAGGEILFGTDVGYIYQFDTAEEYTLMQSAGMTFPQILASLTTNPAHRFGFVAHSGTIAPGMDADLAVFTADPAADITAFSRVRYTIRAGKIIFQSSAPAQSPTPN